MLFVLSLYTTSRSYISALSWKGISLVKTFFYLNAKMQFLQSLFLPIDMIKLAVEVSEKCILRPEKLKSWWKDWSCARAPSLCHNLDSCCCWVKVAVQEKWRRVTFTFLDGNMSNIVEQDNYYLEMLRVLSRGVSALSDKSLKTYVFHFPPVDGCSLLLFLRMMLSKVRATYSDNNLVHLQCKAHK